ncbi:MAG TPA: ABC transporter permease [Chthoniobacterales bacterium]|nr:ABC transporter permease [Chthoniobacterales bacterium]
MNSPSPSGVTKEAGSPKRPNQRAGARTQERSLIGALVGRLEIRMLGLALLLGITLTVLSPHFLTSNNLLNVLDQSVVVGIVSIGMTFVILIGGIDLSVGSVAGCTGVLLGRGLEHLPIPLAIFLAILAGCGIGLFSGVLIARFGLPAFVVTLGVMAIGRSLAYIFSGATSIADLPESFGNIVYTNVFGIPAHVLTLLVLYALSWGYLNFTKGGRTIYAIGSNHEAARTAGLNVLAFSILPYVISGGLSAGAITFASAQVMSIDPLAGTGLELDAIAAVVIGGASLYGGRGSIIGTLIGVLIMVMIRNGLNLLNVSPFWQGSAIGAVIITAVLIERVLSSRTS